jgi:hypothetical protein
MRKHWKTFSATLIVVYILVYGVFSINGSYKPFSGDLNRIWEYRWLPYGFFPTGRQKPTSLNYILVYTFFPLWILDTKYIHNNPPIPAN